MPQSINPLAQLVTKTSESISIANNTVAGSSLMGDALAKADLDSKISQLSGGLNSGLNGLTGNTSTLNSLKSGASSLVAGAGTALGGIGNSISSTVSGGLNSLASVAGSTSNITADISGCL